MVYKWHFSCQLGDGRLATYIPPNLGEPFQQQPLTTCFFKVGGFTSFTVFIVRVYHHPKGFLYSEASRRGDLPTFLGKFHHNSTSHLDLGIDRGVLFWYFEKTSKPGL